MGFMKHSSQQRVWLLAFNSFWFIYLFIYIHHCKIEVYNIFFWITGFFKALILISFFEIIQRGFGSFIFVTMDSKNTLYSFMDNSAEPCFFYYYCSFWSSFVFELCVLWSTSAVASLEMTGFLLNLTVPICLIKE